MKSEITKTFIASLSTATSITEVWDSKLPGLILRRYPGGRMVYVVQWARGRRQTLGKAEVLSPNQARDEALKILGAAARGIDPRMKKKKARDRSLKAYLDEVYEPWALSHLKTGERQLQRIRTCFGDLLKMKLTQITPWHVEKYRTRRLKADIKPNTINKDVQKDVQALRAALRRAYQWGIVPEHPLRQVKPLREDRSARVRYLSTDERKALLAALDDREDRIRQERESANDWRRQRGYKTLPDLKALACADHLKPLVLLALNTGLRRGELFNLQWSDINFSRARLTVERTGAKSRQTRHVPINAEALKTLRDWREQSNGGGYVFAGPDGGRLGHVTTSWRNVITASGVSDFRFHDLRHDFASRLVMAGVDLNTVRELLGHSDSKMTLR